MLRRRTWVVFGLVVAAVAVLGAGWTWEGRRHRSALAQVDREMAAGRYGAARQHLIELSTRWLGPEGVDYRLGRCEGSLGQDEAALEAWGRVPAGSPFAEAAALNSGIRGDEPGTILRRRAASGGGDEPSRPPGRRGGSRTVPALPGARSNRRDACRDRVNLATRESARSAQPRGGAGPASRPRRRGFRLGSRGRVPDRPGSGRPAGSR